MTDEPPSPGAQDHPYNPIFETLAGQLEEEQALPGLVAYSLYKVSKREWIADFRARKRHRPTDQELEDYTRTWTPSQLSNVRAQAAQVLAEYASTVIQEEEPRILRRALEGSFWRGVWPSMVASLIYTLLLVGLAIVLARSGIDLIGIFRDVAGR